GELIICSKGSLGSLENEGYCLFPQNTGNGIPGCSIRPLLQDLINQKRETCRTIPIFYPQAKNDSSAGILTSNFVTNLRGC
ncbi:hypothetical protein DER46DRAFT_488978, partial [Fusarium sp. MPI-SDFR-AT-0072]